MSKLLDLLERIRDGSPAPLGFGAARTETLPGMALLGRASRATRPSRGRRPRGLSRAAVAQLDAAIVDRGGSTDYLTEMGLLLADLPWGAAVAELSETAIAALGESGADLVVATPESAAAGLDRGGKSGPPAGGVHRLGRPGIAGRRRPAGGRLYPGFDRYGNRPLDFGRPGQSGRNQPPGG